MDIKEKKRVHVIACGVLALDMKKLVRDLKLDISVEFLPGGLHETPKKLKEKLQERIDLASKNNIADIIALGYGLCGRGTVGIKARNIPLSIPKVHDCIALFLGSDKEYRKQFAECPGTYYVSAGWVKEKVTPQESCRTCRVTPEDNIMFEELVSKYGKENAEAIEFFFSSWQRNYERAAFIDTGVDSDTSRYLELAKKMAKDYKWRYERLEGTHHLLNELIHQRGTTDEILIVPPNHITSWDALSKGLTAVPVWNENNQKQTLSTLYFNKTRDKITEGEFIKCLDKKPQDIQYGLGIDAGGTYTDIVCFDFDKEKVTAKAKAPTTKWDFTIGINQAIKNLELDNPAEVDLVTISTTLATNAIVEGKGQKVGLLIMPPFGLFSPEDIDYSPIEVIDGRLDINGKEISPIDEEQVVKVAEELISNHGVRAFAVTGFASINNNLHELEVKRIIREKFGCTVTCGHEISSDLNYRTRSITSALNARIIPCLEKLLTEISVSLAAMGINATQMVVRSDGSLMNIKTALEKPIETILSGPAASAKGAGFLANVEDGLVVDIGGTTTDTAIISEGKVQVNSDGATVGGYRTHIKTLDLRTTGLGGDSNIRYKSGNVCIGPERVLPVCRLAEMEPAAYQALEWIEGCRDKFADDTEGVEIIALADHESAATDSWNEKEREIIALLKERPRSLAELCKLTDCFAPAYLPLHNLENEYVVQRCGFTPTDLLHILELFTYWDIAAARKIGLVFAIISGCSLNDFAEKTLEQFRKLLAVDMIKRELSTQVDVEELEKSPVAQVLLDNLFAGGDKMYKAAFDLQHPVIGIGAPARYLIAPANEWLGVDCIVPPHGEVANAVGAIISSVHVERTLRIEAGADGDFIIQGIAGSPEYKDFEQAHEAAVSKMYDIVLEAAEASGAEAAAVKISWYDKITDLAGGSTLFLGRIFTGEVSGMPKAFTGTEVNQSD